MAVALAALVVGCGPRTNDARRSGQDVRAALVDLQVAVKTPTLRARRGKTRRYSLRCSPPGGSMPDAKRLCRDIALHPVSMLTPPHARSVCAGAIFAPEVSISGFAHGERIAFGGEPGCDWPGGAALAIYWSAVTGNKRFLAAWEGRLRCDDNPTLLAKPTPWRSVFACTHDLWTPRNAKLIRLAETLAQIHGLRPHELFPSQIGVRSCRLPAGGPSLGRHILVGKCEVNVTDPWKAPRVSFTESWPVGSRTDRHTWVVVIRHDEPHLDSQRGKTPPQYWI